MAEKHLIAAVTRRFEGMSRSERIAKIKKLADESPEDKKFIRQTFPDLYREAHSANRAATRSRFPRAGRPERP